LASLKGMSFPIISIENPLILASASPRRKRLLAQAGLPFRIIKSQVDEKKPARGPAQGCRELAEKKAWQVYLSTESSWVLGADTMVIIDDKILGKPRDEMDARQMLYLLGGKAHEVMTGFCLIDPSGRVAHSEVVGTMVRFKPLTGQEIDAYISTGEPFGKAGGYGIQGIGAFMVESISGSYTNVVGLPLCAVIKALIGAGALTRFPLPTL